MTHAESRGFTLVEVCIALAVLGILAGIGYNPMKNYLKRVEHRNSVNHIKRLIQTCQSKAMADPNSHIGVYFDASEQRVISFQDKFQPKSYQYDAGKDLPYLQGVTLGKGVSFRLAKDYPEEIIFRGDGSAYKSMKVIITGGKLTDTLDVLASTGRVRVSR